MSFETNSSIWENAYIANPKFYSDSFGQPFGAFALTEDTVSVFPINPKNSYKIDGKNVDIWKMLVISTTTNSVLCEIDYFKALKLLNEQYKIDNNENFLLIKGIPFNELKLFCN